MMDPRSHRQSWLILVSDILNAFVRPLLAVWFGAGVLYFTYSGMLTPDAFLAIAAMIIGFYFEARQAEKAQQRLTEQQAELVAMARDLPPPAPPTTER